MLSILKLTAAIAFIALSGLQSVASSSMAGRDYTQGDISSRGAKLSASKFDGQEPRSNYAAANLRSPSSAKKSENQGSAKKTAMAYATEEFAAALGSSSEEVVPTDGRGNSGIFMGKEAARDHTVEKMQQESMSNSLKPTEEASPTEDNY